MGPRDRIKARPDVDEADVDEIIEIAQELADDQAAPKASIQEVEAVAEELDIPPELVEQAVEVLEQRRRQAERQEAAEAEQRAEWLRMAGLVAGGLALLVLAVWGVRAQRTGAADRQVQQAEVALLGVLDRQAALAPQLVALAGGGGSPQLTLAADQVRSASDIEQKLRAADVLSLTMARELGALDNVDEDVRLNLHHEITGTQNRLSVERTRYEQALAQRDRSGGCGG